MEEQSKHKGGNRFTETIAELVNSKIVSVSVIALSAYLSVASIAEVMARQELLNIFEAKVIELTREGLEHNKNLLADIVKKQGDVNSAVKDIEEKNRDLATLIGEIRKLSTRLRTLTLGGSNRSSETLMNIAFEYQKLLKATLPNEEPQNEFIILSAFSTIDFISWRSSTFLIATLAVLSGIIGSLVTVFRLDKYSIDFLKRIVLGIATGYISFLLIKGGRSLFLLEGTDVLPILNPYSAALFSLIGGMFTEKVFALLGDLFDGLIRRLNGKGNTQT